MTEVTKKIEDETPLSFKKALRLAQAFREAANGGPKKGILCYGVRYEGWGTEEKDCLYPRLTLDLFLDDKVKITALAYDDNKDKAGHLVLVDRISRDFEISLREDKISDLQKTYAGRNIKILKPEPV
jgi:hypothetical protein